jgi:hypothetical protein
MIPQAVSWNDKQGDQAHRKGIVILINIQRHRAV